ncbi:MAG TPA: bifunctional chorismate mutase/prephenate dehydratase [Clostridiales bacterium]|nr:bifunctional chorismate mutase/prephenate dehydratase [Clostridiales bacterium]
MDTQPDSQPGPAAELNGFRSDIGEIDRELIDLFNRRMALARRIAEFKARSRTAVFDPQREDEVVKQAVTQALPADAIRVGILLRSLMRLSRGAQYDAILAAAGDFELGRRIREAPSGLPELGQIVYQGSAGSYAAQASQRLFPGVPAIQSATWEEACRLVQDGQADLAVLPWENSTAGTVDAVYDLLLQHDLLIWRSLSLPIQHRLLGTNHCSLDGIHTVISHPQALAQCSDLIRRQGWKVRESLNTAFAAETVAQTGDPGLAAIASDEAAAAHGLEVILSDIANSQVNQTRFIAVGKTLRVTPDADRVSLVLRLPHRSGSLAATLAVFGDYGLNLNKIQSRPDLANPWTYLFYLDFECFGSQLQPMLATLYQLSREMPLLRFLGWYHEE